MYKQTLGVVCVLATLAGCAYRPENPVDHLRYRNQPLVQQVELDMSQQQVLAIAGPPSSEMQRTVESGTCQDYILSQDDHRQAYHVSFDSAGRVDGKGFTSCTQMERNARAPARIGGGGGGGY